MDSGKSWRRRLRSPIRRLFLAFVATAQWASAQPSSNDSDGAARGFATLQTFLDSVQSLTADFEQEIWMGDTRVQTDRGSLSLKRPNRFRWNYVDPTELVVAADGKQLWIYDVELEQVTVAPFDDSLGASPATLLAGDGDVREQFDVVQTYTADGLDWVKLAPRGGGSDFTSVLIGFSGTAPRRLELVDGLNEVTRIQLDNLDLNPDLADNVFELDVPANVDVIGDEG
jgi:outer membrane lipoprotein carrier protein